MARIQLVSFVQLWCEEFFYLFAFFFFLPCLIVFCFALFCCCLLEAWACLKRDEGGGREGLWVELRGMKGGGSEIAINCLRKKSTFSESKPPSSVTEGFRLLALAQSRGLWCWNLQNMAFTMNFKIRYTCEHDSFPLLRNSKADFTGREGDTPYGFYGGPRDLAQPWIQQG